MNSGSFMSLRQRSNLLNHKKEKRSPKTTQPTLLSLHILTDLTFSPWNYPQRQSSRPNGNHEGATAPTPRPRTSSRSAAPPSATSTMTASGPVGCPGSPGDRAAAGWTPGPRCYGGTRPRRGTRRRSARRTWSGRRGRTDADREPRMRTGAGTGARESGTWKEGMSSESRCVLDVALNMDI